MTTLSITDICNMALARIGQRNITSLTDTQNTAAIACNNNYVLAIQEVSRAHAWNCLAKFASLAAIVQTPLPTNLPTPTTAWAPLTAYLANQYVTYGGYIYQCLVGYTSTSNFTNDLTAGYWFQTDYQSPLIFTAADGGSAYPSGWAFQYALPSDYVLILALNDNPCEQGTGEFEIAGNYLYCNQSTATIKYAAYVTDTTQYDGLFTAALVFNIAAKVATILRQDDMAIAERMMQGYRKALSEARVKDSGEGRRVRFNPSLYSNFVRSRWCSTNG